jgi:hypothetical protein
MAGDISVAPGQQQRRQVRRTALLLGLIALAIYGAYILFALKYGHP